MDTQEWVALKDSISRDHRRIEWFLFCTNIATLLVFVFFIIKVYNTHMSELEAQLSADTTEHIEQTIKQRG